MLLKNVDDILHDTKIVSNVQIKRDLIPHIYLNGSTLPKNMFANLMEKNNISACSELTNIMAFVSVSAGGQLKLVIKSANTPRHRQ